MNADFILWTDGSGRDLDGFAGYAAVAKTPDGLVQRCVVGSMSESTVDRAEFTALIEGLRLCQEMQSRFPEGIRSEFEEVPKRKVHWFSDRENLVLSVKKVYGRTNCLDLWAALEYYETIFEIEAQHVTEPYTETQPEFVEVDLQSSTMRMVMKAYYADTPLHIDVQYKDPKSRRKAKAADPKTE